jgi:hypothetical protein
VAQQGEHAVGDQVDGGLVAGDEQQRYGAQELSLVHPSGRVIAGHQPGEQVVRGVGPARGDEPAQVLEHLQGGLRGLPHLLLAHALCWVKAARKSRRPAVEARLILARDAEQFADHRHRQRVG